MKVIGYQFIGSETSTKRKHYTVLLTEFGDLLTYHGGLICNNKTKKISEFMMTKGTLTHEDVSLSTSAVIFEKMNEIFRAKSEGTYDTVEWNFTPSTIKAALVPASTFTVDNVVDIINYWMDLTKTTFDLLDSDTMERYDSTVDRRVVRAARNQESTSNDEALFNARHLVLNMVESFNTRERLAPPMTEATKTVVDYRTDVEADIIRPNGEVYKPRAIMGHTDVALLREFRKNNVYVRLAGPPGGGKTALAEAAMGSDLITVSGHGDFTVANLVGTYLPLRDGGWEWHDGPLSRAMREGLPLFVDEGTRIPTEVLNILFSVLDGRMMLRIDDNPNLPILHAKEGFYVLMGYNPDTLGARPLDEALVSRFRVQINVETDFDTARSLGVPPLIIKVAENLKTKSDADKEAGNPTGYWVPGMRELLTCKTLAEMNLGNEFVFSALVGACPRPDDVPMLIKTIHEVAKVTVGPPSLGGLV